MHLSVMVLTIYYRASGFAWLIFLVIDNTYLLCNDGLDVHGWKLLIGIFLVTDA